MLAFEVMQHLVWDWGVQCFGLHHMRNNSIRALRLAEEAVELAQCLKVPQATMHKLIDTVYSRPEGNVAQELGGVLVTTSVLIELFGLNVDKVFEMELKRCLSKSPEHFAKRNQDKIDLGLDA